MDQRHQVGHVEWEMKQVKTISEESQEELEPKLKIGYEEKTKRETRIQKNRTWRISKTD